MPCAAEAIRREAQVEAREQALKLRADVEQELKDKRAEIAKIEERVITKEEEIDLKLTEMERREQGLLDREGHLKQLQEETKAAKDSQLRELERISSLTVEEAKRQVLERSEELVRHDLARMVRQLEEEARGDAKRRRGTSSPMPSSASPPAMRPRRPSRSSSFPQTT